MKVIRFLQQLAPYNVGETAGFADADSDNLVMRGVAEHTKIEPQFAERSPDQDPPRITGRDLQQLVADTEVRGQRQAPRT